MGALPDEVTKQFRDEVMTKTTEALAREGLTPDYFVHSLKKEMSAKTTKFIKFKGKVEKDEAGKPILARGVKIIVQGEKREIGGGEDAVAYDDGDTVIAVNEIDWGTRQTARMDGQKLWEMYPTKKVEMGGPGGGPIPVTNFPPTAASLDEWQRQMEEAEARRLAKQAEGGES